MSEGPAGAKAKAAAKDAKGRTPSSSAGSAAPSLFSELRAKDAMLRSSTKRALANEAVRRLLAHGPKGRFTVHSIKRSQVENYLASASATSALSLRIRRLTRDATTIDIDIVPLTGSADIDTALATLGDGS